MKKTCIYIATCASLVLAGIILARFFPLEQGETPSLLSEEMSFASFLPEGLEVPREMIAAPAVPFALEYLPAHAVDQPQEQPSELVELFVKPSGEQPVPEPAILLPPVMQQSHVVSVEESSAPVPSKSTSAAPSYIYFYTNIPVQSTPLDTTVHTSNFTTVTVAPVPVVRSYVVPVFTPQVVPSRTGAPKLIYSNGVVIKPKVYFPHQPLRNTVRAATP